MCAQYGVLVQVPDFLNACIAGEPAMSAVKDEQWFRHDFTPTVAGRGRAASTDPALNPPHDSLCRLSCHSRHYHEGDHVLQTIGNLGLGPCLSCCLM